MGRVDKIAETPHEPGRGWLKNNNRPGDLSQVKRCGAENRCGTPCGGPAMANGRCRLHAGLSTGPKTLAGIERIRRAVTKHGHYSQSAKAELQDARRLIKDFRSTAEDYDELPISAWYGLVSWRRGDVARKCFTAHHTPARNCYTNIRLLQSRPPGTKRWLPPTAG